ncbi:adenosine deaminase [Streptomyces sp. CA-111067]|uniref:adenosine deaminase n=1 Tax=Streptomyces sp. CA-111067 TaxID=3240046 RepID=UPI003D96666A
MGRVRGVRELVGLPKAHLHVHLEGAMRGATFDELAGGRGLAGGGFGTFGDFLGVYGAAARLVRDGPRENLMRVVREVVEDAAADGAVWVEPHFNPLTYEDDPRAALELLDAVIGEGRRAGARLGVGFGVLVYARRNGAPAEAVETARLAADRAGDGVVAFGLAGDESQYGPEPFAEAFGIARRAGLIPAPHAGELAGPASVRAAVDRLGARRIAHGVRAVEEPALVARLAREGVVLDVCPTSNVALGVVPSMAAHPLPLLLEAGVRCTLNADDPLLFGAGLLDEYETARSVLALTDAQLAAVARTSVRSSGAPAAAAEEAVARIDAWLEAEDAGNPRSSGAGRTRPPPPR